MKKTIKYTLLVLGLLVLIPFNYDLRAQATTEEVYKDRYCLFGGTACLKKTYYWNGKKVRVVKMILYP